MNRTLRLRRLIMTTTRQGAGCPVVDGATIQGTTISERGVEPFRAQGVCICLSPRGGRALSIGIVGGPALPWRAAGMWRPRFLFAPRRNVA